MGHNLHSPFKAIKISTCVGPPNPSQVNLRVRERPRPLREEAKPVTQAGEEPLQRFLKCVPQGVGLTMFLISIAP